MPVAPILKFNQVFICVSVHLRSFPDDGVDLKIKDALDILLIGCHSNFFISQFILKLERTSDDFSLCLTDFLCDGIYFPASKALLLLGSVCAERRIWSSILVAKKDIKEIVGVVDEEECGGKK